MITAQQNNNILIHAFVLVCENKRVRVGELLLIENPIANTHIWNFKAATTTTMVKKILMKIWQN